MTSNLAVFQTIIHPKSGRLQNLQFGVQLWEQILSGHQTLSCNFNLHSELWGGLALAAPSPPDPPDIMELMLNMGPSLPPPGGVIPGMPPAWAVAGSSLHH